jgi:hypothetical protein
VSKSFSENDFCMDLCLAVVWAYVRKVLIHWKSIKHVYHAIRVVVHAVMQVRTVVSVANRDHFWYMIQIFVLDHVRRIIIPIINFENVFVVRLVVHPVKPVLMFVLHVQLVMHLRIQIVFKQRKNVVQVNILISLKIGKSEERHFFFVV